MSSVRNAIARTCHWLAEWLTPKRFAAPPSEPDRIVIEFLGGPLDGHAETVSRVSLNRMKAWIEVPISRTLFDVLNGAEPSNVRQLTSVAIYDLVPLNSRWRFRFRCQTSIHHQRDRAQA